jgi:hypothetical protein
MKTIAVDFDGVIHKYSKGYMDGSIYDEPMDGAMEAIHFLWKRGYTVVCLTARPDLEGVKKWIFERIGPYTPEQYKSFDVTNIKPKAIAYIDDRGLRFTSWRDMLNYF